MQRRRNKPSLENIAIPDSERNEIRKMPLLSSHISRPLTLQSSTSWKRPTSPVPPINAVEENEKISGNRSFATDFAVPTIAPTTGAVSGSRKGKSRKNFPKAGQLDVAAVDFSGDSRSNCWGSSCFGWTANIRTWRCCAAAAAAVVTDDDDADSVRIYHPSAQINNVIYCNTVWLSIQFKICFKRISWDVRFIVINITSILSRLFINSHSLDY